MRILFLLTQDLESPSGLGRYWPLARELASYGHQVRIAALHSNWAGLAQRSYEREGVHIEYVAPMHVQKIGSQKRYYSTLRLIGVILRATWALCRASLAAPVDVIQVGKPHPMNGIAGSLARWRYGGVLCVDCDDYEAQINRFGAGWQRKVVAYFERRLPRMAQVVTTHTQFMRDNLLAWGCAQEKIHYLSNGVDRARFIQPDQGEVEALRERLDLQGKRVVAYLGSLSQPSHPVDLLVRAFQPVLARFPEAVLLLVGGGEDISPLETLVQQLGIERAVRFTGRVPAAQVHDHYALAEVTVDPVHDDEAARGRSPLKMFESWIMGVPFVTSPVGERPRLAGHPPACQMAAPAGDAHALSRAIQEVLSSAELAETLTKRGYRQVEEYTWERLARQLEAVYQTAVRVNHDGKR